MRAKSKLPCKTTVIPSDIRYWNNLSKLKKIRDSKTELKQKAWNRSKIKQGQKQLIRKAGAKNPEGAEDPAAKSLKEVKILNNSENAFCISLNFFSTLIFSTKFY